MNNMTNQFNVGDRVVYIPYHAHGNVDHEDCEYGVITSTNSRYVFVCFEEDSVSRQSKACKPDQLRHQ
jgi:hypothetical protein